MTEQKQKFHINSNGQPAPCTASERACPLGGEHFDSAADAAKAAVRKQVGTAIEGDITEPIELTEADMAVIDAALEKAGMSREELWGSYRYDFDPMTTGGLHPTRMLKKLAENPAALREEIDQAGDGRGAYFYKEFPHYADELADALPKKPVNELTEAFPQKEAQFQGEFYKGLNEARNNGLAGTPQLLHRLATRSADRAGLNNFEKVVATNKLTQKHWKQDLYPAPEAPATPEASRSLPAPSGASSRDDRDPNHYYGPWKGKVDMDVETPARSSSGPKELDPAMIEALKLKYLKKFKQPFDESGLSVPELLQMAQKGELD